MGRVGYEELSSLQSGTALLYEDRSQSPHRLDRAIVDGYEQHGKIRILRIKLEDGTIRYPGSGSLYWP